MNMLTTPIPRRSLLRLLMGSLLAMVGAEWLLPSRASAGSRVALLRQLVSRDVSRGRILMWQGETLPDRVRVLVQGGGLKEAIELSPSYTYLPSEEELPYIFSARLEGLEPGRQYTYRICCDEAESDWLPLWTPSEDAVCSALLFSDNQSTDGYRGFRRLVLRALLRHEQTSLLLLTGDMVDNGQLDWYWRQFFGSLEGVAERLPLAPALGNHECYDADWQPTMPRDYLSRLHTPPNGSLQGWEGHYYSYDWGCVHFAVLDTQWEEERGFGRHLVTEQLQWLRRDMAASRKQWRVVVLHRDVIDYSALQEGLQGPAIEFTQTGRVFMPVFEELGVDAVLSGHLHIYRRRCPIRGFKPADNGPLYICCGVSGNDRGYREVRSRFDVVMERSPEEACYLQLVARPAELTFKAFTAKGASLDSVTLRKQ